MNTWTNYSLTCSYKKSSSRVLADICIDNRLTARLKVFFNLETGRGWWMELPTQFALGPHSETYEEYDVLKKKSEKIVFELLRGIKLGCIHFMKCIPNLPKPSDLPQKDGDLATFDFFVDSRKYTLHLHRFKGEYEEYHKLGLCLSGAGEDRFWLNKCVKEDESRSKTREQLKNIIIGSRLLEKAFNSEEVTR